MDEDRLFKIISGDPEFFVVFYWEQLQATIPYKKLRLALSHPKIQDNPHFQEYKTAVEMMNYQHMVVLNEIKDSEVVIEDE